MSFETLALVVVLGLAGPLLAVPRRLTIPIVIGELAAGAVFGRTGFDVLHTGDATFTFLADVGFALVMFVAGTHVPLRDPRVIGGLKSGTIRLVLVAAAASALGVGIATAFGTGHAVLYAVLMASSSAALVLPVVDSLGLSGDAVLTMVPQVALADTICIVALPLAIDPKHAGRAALGACAVIVACLAIYLTLRWIQKAGRLDRLDVLSTRRKLELELRISLVLVFAVAALATWTHVSIMLAGFGCGLAVAAIGEPQRLASQLFAVADGFFAPLFFVWLGASINLRELGTHPAMIGVGVALGAGALTAHLVPVLLRQPPLVSVLASGQLGVPIGAAALGEQLHLLRPGEASAMLLGAVLTVGAVTIAGVVLSKQSGERPPAPQTL